MARTVNHRAFPRDSVLKSQAASVLPNVRAKRAARCNYEHGVVDCDDGERRHARGRRSVTEMLDRRIDNGFDAMAIGVNEKGGVIVRAVLRPQSRPTVVSSANF